MIVCDILDDYSGFPRKKAYLHDAVCSYFASKNILHHYIQERNEFYHFVGLDSFHCMFQCSYCQSIRLHILQHEFYTWSTKKLSHQSLSRESVEVNKLKLFIDRFCYSIDPSTSVFSPDVILCG